MSGQRFKPRPIGSVLDLGAAFWFGSGLAGMIVAAAAVVSGRFDHLSTAAELLIAVGLGWVTMLALAPWKRIIRRWSDREEIRRITGCLRQFGRDRRRDALRSLLSDRDDEIGELRRAIHDTFSGAAADRLEARRLRRTLDDSVRRETRRATGRLQREASTDPLTGLGNRRALEVQLADHLEALRRDGRPLTALLIDVDRFKRINDELGHPAGDTYLAFLGKLLRGGLREGDGAFRNGGDEFVVLMPGQPSDVGRMVAKRIRSLVGQMSWPHKQPPRPTLSIGVATALPVERLEPSELIRRADQAMYEAKRGGRARTVCYSSRFTEASSSPR